MSVADDEKTISTSIEKLSEKNYRAWAVQVRSILREKKLFDIVDGTTPAPAAPVREGMTADELASAVEAYNTATEEYEPKAMTACRILLSTISGRLITYVEDEDNPVRIWSILRDRFRPTTDITLAQSLKYLFGMRMAEDGDMEAHVRDFTAAKRRVEEHAVKLSDIVYRTIFLLSLPTAYQMTVTALEGQSGITLEAAENRLLDDYRKRRVNNQGMVMSALNAKVSKSTGRKTGNLQSKASSKSKPDLFCNHCNKKGHVEATCWDKHPELRPKKQQSTPTEARVAFRATQRTVRKANVDGRNANGEKGAAKHWIVDSGASDHFTPYRHLYSRYTPLESVEGVQTAKGELHAIGIGTIDITVVDGKGNPREVELKNVLHVPGMDSNLLSSNVLVERGFEVSMHPTKGTRVIRNDEVFATTVTYGRLQRLKIPNDSDDGKHIAQKATGPKPTTPELQKLPYDTWHRRLAHLGPWNVKKLQGMANGMAIDMETFSIEDDQCEACIQGHQTRNLSDTPMRRRTVPGDLIHSDVCGWITPNSLGDGKYFLTFIDDATRMTYLYILKSKSAKEVQDCFLNFRNVFEQDGRRIKAIRTDGGGEYRKQMADLFIEFGISHEETAPYTPEQNGVAERANRTICNRVRSILAETGLPKELWAELACTVVHLKNRSPTRSLKDKTPYEALYGTRPDLSNLVAIGTKAYVHIPKQKTKKMDLRSENIGFMVGYGGNHQYRIWDPRDNKVIVTRDVQFVGEARKDPAVSESGEKVVLDGIVVLPEPKGAPTEKLDQKEVEKDSESEIESDEEAEKFLEEEDKEDPSMEPGPFDSTTSALQPFPVEPRIRKPPKRFDEEEYNKQGKRVPQAHLSMIMWSEFIEPQTYDEAVNHPTYGKEWELAIKEEYDSMIKNGAWELVELPVGKNVVSCKWVFKAKRDASGQIVRFKARLVARGFSQVYGVDYLDTYSPVAKLTTYRIIFALASLQKWEIHGMDVVTAFPLGSLDEEIYMAQPEGFMQNGMKRGLVCRLLKSIYGLKQAARVWNKKIEGFLRKLGFIQSNADHCLYIHPELDIWIIIWVDDLLIAGKNERSIVSIKRQLSSAFEMKDLGKVSHFLGMRITQNSDGIAIDQAIYVRTILERFGMEESKPTSTPLATGTQLAKATNDDELIDQRQYQAIIGSLMYAMLCTRPDIAYAVQQLSQFASKPTNAHFQAAKRVLRYLQGSHNVGLIYGSHSKDLTAVQGYCDANYAADEDRKSISGYVFTLAGSPISWQAKKQSTIALSTVEAEYAALTQAVKEAIWIQNLLKDLGMAKYSPRIINCDNQGTIALADNPTHHARTKHLDVQLQFVRDHVERRTIELSYCPTQEMTADIFTKALGRDRHRKLMESLGMQELESGTPSSVRLGRRISRITSGSVELRNPPILTAWQESCQLRG